MPTLWIARNVLYKKNQGKSMRKEGAYSGEVGHNIGQNFENFQGASE